MASRLRIRTPIFAMLFTFSFTGYVQRQGVSVAAEILREATALL